jgi:hypothetical protein
MFIKSKNYDACIQKVRIELGRLVGLEHDDEAYILLKELPTLLMLKLKGSSEKGEQETLVLLKELLPSILVDHNFYEDEHAKKKMRNEELADLIFSSLEITVKVVSEYTQAGFFTQAQKSVAPSPPSVQKSSMADTVGSSITPTDTGCPT